MSRLERAFVPGVVVTSGSGLWCSMVEADAQPVIRGCYNRSNGIVRVVDLEAGLNLRATA